MKGKLQCVRTLARGMTNDFPLEMNMDTSRLSSYMFNLVLDVLIKDIQKSILNCVINANDIVLIEEIQ